MYTAETTETVWELKWERSSIHCILVLEKKISVHLGVIIYSVN